MTVADATTAAANLPFSSRLTQLESAVSQFIDIKRFLIYIFSNLILLYKKDVENFVVM